MSNKLKKAKGEKRYKTLESGYCPIIWETFKTKSDYPGLVLGGFAIDWTEDPWKEADGNARKMAADSKNFGADVILIIGNGLGYFPSMLASLRSDLPVIVYDEFEGIPEKVGNDKIVRVRSPDEFDAAINEYIEAGAKIYMVQHPHTDEPNRWESNYATNIINRSFVRDDRTTDRTIVSRRSIQFLGNFPNAHLITELDGELDDTNVIIVSGGEFDTDLIKASYNGKTVIMAAAQAVGRLNDAGFEPQIAVVADPSDVVAHMMDDAKFGICIGDALTHPMLFDKYKDRMYYFCIEAAHHHYPAWRESGLPAMHDTPAMATVSEMMVMQARSMGSSKLLLLGFDYSQQKPGGLCQMPVMNQRKEVVYTYTHYWHGCRYLDTFVARAADIEVVRMSEHGIATPHIAGPYNQEFIPNTHRAPTKDERKEFGLNKTEDDGISNLEREQLILKNTIQALNEGRLHLDPDRGKDSLKRLVPILHRPLAPVTVKLGQVMTDRRLAKLGGNITNEIGVGAWAKHGNALCAESGPSVMSDADTASLPDGHPNRDGIVWRPRVLLITTVHSTVIQYVMRDMEEAFRALGCEVRLQIEENKDQYVTPGTMVQDIIDFKPAFAMLIDHLSPEYGFNLPSNFPWVSWNQDPLPHLWDKKIIDKLRPVDFTYSAHEAWTGQFLELGYPHCKTLPMGFNPSKFFPKAEKQRKVIAHICNMEPYYTQFMPAYPGLQKFLEIKFVAHGHTRGDMAKLREYVVEFGSVPDEFVNAVTAEMHLKYERYYDRREIAFWMMESGIPFELYGNGWETDPLLKPHHRGTLKNGSDELRQVYARSAAVVHVNNHFNLHPRVFECYASGGLVIMRRIPGQDVPGMSFDGRLEFVNHCHTALKNNSKDSGQGNVLTDWAMGRHTYFDRAKFILDDMAKVLRDG